MHQGMHIFLHAHQGMHISLCACIRVHAAMGTHAALVCNHGRARAPGHMVMGAHEPWRMCDSWHMCDSGRSQPLVRVRTRRVVRTLLGMHGVSSEGRESVMFVRLSAHPVVGALFMEHICLGACRVSSAPCSFFLDWVIYIFIVYRTLPKFLKF